MVIMKQKFKVILQQDEKDCGVACLATICNYYGKQLPLHKIRELAKVTEDGSSLYSLKKAGSQLDFECESYQVETITEMQNEATFPLIAHIITESGYGHYIVIFKINNDTLIIGDPEDGLHNMKVDKFLKRWHGIILTLKPNNDFQKESYANQKKQLFKYILQSNSRQLITVVIVSLLINSLGMTGSFFYKIYIDYLIPSGTFHYAVFLGILVITSYVIQSILGFYRQKSIVNMSKEIDKKLILESYYHILHLPMDFFDTRKKGEILSRLQDAFKIHEVVCGTALSATIDSIMVILAATFLIILNPILFAICTGSSIINLFITLLLKTKIEALNRELMQNESMFNAKIIEFVSGIEVIKTNLYENTSYKKLKNTFDKVMESMIHRVNINAIQTEFANFFTSSSSIIILLAGMSFIFQKKMSIGDLVMFNTMLSYFLNPIENIINLIPEIQEAKVATERLCELLDLEPEDISKSQRQSLDTPIEKICMKHVQFEYGDHTVLKNINLSIKKGECIAIVGESGTGKSTLIKVLMGMYPVTNGEILFNDKSLKEIGLYEIRKKFAYVPQNTFLFADSITNNLLMGQSLNKNSIIDICKDVDIYSKITSMPLEYESILEENGYNLSGGERQRLAIARSLLKKDAEVYIFDEATSNLDIRTEHTIQQVLFEKLQGKIRIIIAHRLNTVCKCDRIIVLEEDGHIHEEGTHKELLSKKGKYYQLWNRQNEN